MKTCEDCDGHGEIRYPTSPIWRVCAMCDGDGAIDIDEGSICGSWIKLNGPRSRCVLAIDHGGHCHGGGV